MPRFLYSLLFYLLAPALLLRLFWRSIKEPAYRESLGQRFGFVDYRQTQTRPIWVHAVSAGETIAAIPLIERLLLAGHEVVLTSMTPTGRERGKALLGERVTFAYAPYDMPDAVNRFLTRVRPICYVVIDTELWPNTIHSCARHDIPGILVNGRLSARSAAGYQKVSALVRPMLNEISQVVVQTKAHGERFLALGLAQEKLVVAGSLKFDNRLPADYGPRTGELRALFGDRIVVLAASTHSGEETLILETYKALEGSSQDKLLLVLAPRHPHRCDEVSNLVTRQFEETGALIRHSDSISCRDETKVLLLDTMGELIYFYGSSDIAIVGGSLVPVGGHNMMEPALAGTPIIMGKHLENFADIAALFLEKGGLTIVQNTAELRDQLHRLIQSPSERETQVRQARAVLEENRGALDLVEKLILDRLQQPSG